ncbi:hypothetical protein RJ639_014076 [Escallonia herrerae]|uniref:Uncharacterized protein n=1 Tax=Escallonia herrerae TaxID=1293975 RepID=A0AA89ANI7_9ASTE|nr:hypothetical protein RJ639_014076 [Escallonia herrerae]
MSATRNLYMRYTVKWVDWDSSFVPVRIYIFGVTDTWKRSDEITKQSTRHDCQIEYVIESCNSDVASDGCFDTKRVSLSMPTGGDVIYGVAHQHTGGIGSALYGEDGRVICFSIPTYGEGEEAGNESGYIVRMSTCYPRPGSVKISSGETLILESNYSSAQRHTGVMGLFNILVAEPLKPDSFFHGSVKMHEKLTAPQFVWVEVLLGVTIAIAALAAYRQRSQREDGKGNVYYYKARGSAHILVLHYFSLNLHIPGSSARSKLVGAVLGLSIADSISFRAFLAAEKVGSLQGLTNASSMHGVRNRIVKQSLVCGWPS